VLMKQLEARWFPASRQTEPLASEPLPNKPLPNKPPSEG